MASLCYTRTKAEHHQSEHLCLNFLQPAPLGDVRFHRWTANPKQQAIRVHATCAGTMCIIYLHRGKHLTPEQDAPASFCTALYDSIQVPYFQFATRSHHVAIPIEKDDQWLHPTEGLSWIPTKDYDACTSNELFDLIRAQLPGALQPRFSTDSSPSTGTFCYLTIEDDPEHPGQASINMRSDLFRHYLLEDLYVLEPEMFPNIERIDLSRISILNFVNTRMQVLKVAVAQADGDSTDELVLKIGVLADYEGPERSSKRMEESRGHQQRHFQELVNWSKVWGHENIMRPPKYLVTVQDGDRVKLVGWLQVVHRVRSEELIRPHMNKGDDATVRKLLGYVTDLARGMLHMTKKGYIHPDVKWDNCLFDGPEHEDHLVIFDFEHFSDGPGVYYNLTGPRSPEVVGHWDVSFDDTGRLCYSRAALRNHSRTRSILADWAEFPEAIERLQVFTFACVAADMIKYQSPNRDHRDPYYLKHKELESVQKARSKWEEIIPDAVKTLLEECWSFDPRQRPLLEDILRRLTEIRDALDNSTPSNRALDQSKDIASPE